jgi:pilus assembly protein FimV
VVRVDKPVAFIRLVAAAVMLLPVLAHSAGLGRLSVQSYLGQPLRAEIEVVSVQPGEEASLEARLASGNAFAQAGIEFNPALSTTQFALDKRDGRLIIRVSTRQPVNEPFVDLLVELRWSSGLFVREYTILLDPPGYEGPKAQPIAAEPARVPAVAATESPAAAPSAPVAPASTPAATGRPAAEAQPAAGAATAAAERAKPAEAPASASPSGAGTTSPSPISSPADQTYEVKKGDTLGEIATRYRPAGVTFHQMLIALQRANEDAFINNNINLVRAGRILNIPGVENATAVEAADATRLVGAQHAEFAEYRSRLGTAVAAAPAAPQAAERTAAGQIAPKPAEPKPAAAKDQLTLSRADSKKPGTPGAKAAQQDDVAARQRELQEAQSRVSALEKNVADLNKLVEMRNQQLAQLEQKSGAKPAPTAAPKPAPEAPKPAAASKPAAEAPKPVAEAPKPVAEAPKPVADAPKPVAEAPKPPAPAKPKPRPVAPPPPEPSLLDDLLGDPVMLGGLGGVVLLLAGYGAFAWQRKKKAVSKFQDSVLGAPSVAPAPAAGDATTGGTPSVSQTSVSQSGVGGMDTEDVDPIAEADVYMAYGRDAQAEEILKEALHKDPNRVPVISKLLEIYANRRDAQSFEQHAAKLKSITNGAGPEWDKAMVLGRSVDPGNGLYGGAPGSAPAAAPAAPVAVAAPAVDFDIGGGGGAGASVNAEPSLDLDLGGAQTAAEEKSDFSPSGTLIIDAEETKAASSGLDFDLGGGDKAADTGGMNFELPATAAEPEATPAPVSAPAASSGGLDFDLNLGGSADSKESAAAPAMDLSAISLDLGTPGESSGGGDASDPKWQEVATKLDLAKAYEEMGDKDGARELLNEVMREGDSAQQGQAQQLMAKLG